MYCCLPVMLLLARLSSQTGLPRSCLLLHIFCVAQQTILILHSTYAHINLVGPNFNHMRPVDMLIVRELLWMLIKQEQIHIGTLHDTGADTYIIWLTIFLNFILYLIEFTTIFSLNHF